jgi:hypothetical protein
VLKKDENFTILRLHARHKYSFYIPKIHTVDTKLPNFRWYSGQHQGFSIRQLKRSLIAFVRQQFGFACLGPSPASPLAKRCSRTTWRTQPAVYEEPCHPRHAIICMLKGERCRSRRLEQQATCKKSGVRYLRNSGFDLRRLPSNSVVQTTMRFATPSVVSASTVPS